MSKNAAEVARNVAEIRKELLRLRAEYKKTHNGFMDEIRYAPTFGILDSLVNSFENPVTFPNKDEEYQRLNTIYRTFQFLENEREYELIRELQKLIKKHLKNNSNSDWKQNNIEKENYRSDILEDRIIYSLNKLDRLSEDDLQTEHPVWDRFEKSFKYKIDNNWLHNLIYSLNSEFGLPYPSEEQSSKLMNEINRKHSRKLLNETSKDHDDNNNKNIKNNKNKEEFGYFEQIILKAEEEIFKLKEKNKCKDYQGSIISSVLKENTNDYLLSNKNQTHDIKNNDKPDVRSLKTAKFLIHHVDSFKDDPELQNKIYELDTISKNQLKLNSTQDDIYKDIRINLIRKMRLLKLHEDIINLGMHNGDDSFDAVRRKLISAIRDIKENLFSEDLRDLVKAFEIELKAWTPESLTYAGSRYIKHYLKQNYVENNFTETISLEKLTGNFIKPAIELINRSLNILGSDFQNPIKEQDILNNMLIIFKQNFDEIDAKTNQLEKEERIEVKNFQPNIAIELTVPLKNALNLIGSQPDQEKIESIMANQALQQALSAAYLYYDTVRNKTFCSHGREATLLFIKNVYEMENPNPKTFKKQIQNEALKYIKGQGDYGTWYGGASGYSRTSRVGFILDSGLLDDRKADIYPFQTTNTSRLFFPREDRLKFASHTDIAREDFTKRVMSLVV